MPGPAAFWEGLRQFKKRVSSVWAIIFKPVGWAGISRVVGGHCRNCLSQRDAGTKKFLEFLGIFLDKGLGKQ